MQRGRKRILRSFAVLLITLALGPVVVPADDPPSTPDPRVKPGEKFKLSFPNLPKDRHGNTSEMEISVPKEYDPNRYHPLLVFMAGADGSSSAGSAANLADADKFILAGMPYPMGANNAGQSNMVGNFPMMWAYHKKMLEELHKVIPNINPDFRVLAGFSNGGHCIDGELGLGVTDFFNVFILADGGGAKDSPKYRPARGCYMFVCWGEKSPAKGYVPGVASKAAKAGMKVKAMEMKGEGHSFDAENMAKAKEWLETAVVPDLTKAMLARAKKVKSRSPDEALAAIRGMRLLVGEDDEKIEKQVDKILDGIDKVARKELDKIKPALAEDATSPKRKAAESDLRAFIEKYQGAKVADEAKELLEPGSAKEEEKEEDKEKEKKKEAE